MIDYFDIAKCLRDHGVMAEQRFFDDKEYICPALGWLAETFHPACTAFLSRMGIPPVASMNAPIANACTKLALSVRFYAVWLYGQTSPNESRALAFGMFAFDRPEPLPGHKLNVVIVRDEHGAAKPVFYQGYEGIVRLTEENLRLCEAYFF